ncbi:MAG: MATE family efflux transporter [Eubacteriales bacterium]|nr:MATE family efflux transporter [Eubacteriales bacterium]
MRKKLDRGIFVWDREFTGAVVRLALPVLLQALVASFMFIVDNLMIGQLGQSALAGVTQANRITFFMQVTMFGVVSGASVFTAQYWGARDLPGIHKTLGLGMLTAGCVALPFALAAIFIPEQMMRVLIQSGGADDALAAGVEYLRVVGFAYLIQAMSMVQSAVLKSTEQVKLPMYGSFAALLTNLTVNALLIFGKLGFPRLGVTGGAIATVMGCAVELLLLVVGGYKMNFANAAKLADLVSGTREDARRFFRVVLPTMVNEAAWSLGMVMYSIAYGMMGEGTVASISILNNIEQLVSIALRGATHACAVMIGMAIGAGRNKEAELIARRMLVLGVGLGLLTGLVAMLVGPTVIALFPVPPETAAATHTLINTYVGFTWVQALASLLIVGILRAGGDVKYAMIVDILPVWLVGIPMVFLAGPGLSWPIHWVFLLTRIEEVIKDVICIRRLRSGKWIHNLVAKEG